MAARVRARGGVPRVLLGQPRRYSQSPVGRNIRGVGNQAGCHIWGGKQTTEMIGPRVPHMGWETDDGDDWTEVRPRRWKERRQVFDDVDSPRQHHRHRSYAPFRPRRLFLDEGNRNRMQSRDQILVGCSQIRYNAGCEVDTFRQGRRNVNLQHGDGVRQQDGWGYAGHGRDGGFKLVEAGGAMHQKVEDEQYGPVVQKRDMQGLDGAGSVHGKKGVNIKRYVTFYFTNFPAQLSRFYLRKGFEVCGMLEDVHVPRKRNALGAPYGFVRFSNVRDVSKLLKVVNAVYFGHFRVNAKVANFDHNEAKEGRRGIKEGEERTERKALTLRSGNETDRKGGGEGNERAGLITKERNGTEVNTLQMGAGLEEEVRVGEVVVRLGERKTNGTRAGAPVEDVIQNPGLMALRHVEQEASGTSVYVRKYSSTMDDLIWAQNGLIATVKSGEAVPVIQRRIVDAGFNGLVVIPLGAEKVFVRSLTERDVASVVNSAKDFLRADSSTIEKERFDFARILIATPAQEVLKRKVSLKVDGVMVEVQIMEEWGFTLGEDACLLDEESEEVASHDDNSVEHGEREASQQVDMFVEKFVKGVEEDDNMAFQNFAVEQTNNLSTLFVNQEEPVREVVSNQTSPSLEEGHSMDVAVFFPSTVQEVCVRTQVLDVMVPNSIGLDNQGRDDATVMPVVESGERVVPARNRNHSKRTMSCPPGANRSVFSGPWSLDWLQDHNHGDVGVIFSCKKSSKGRQTVECNHKEVKAGERKKKTGGLLRHSIYSLKKVARLPSKDRREVLKVLSKSLRSRKGRNVINGSCELINQNSIGDTPSSTSTKNDWKNWVVMQGTDKIAADDVCDVGKAIGVKLIGDKANMFDILSRTVKGKSKTSGQKSGEGAVKCTPRVFLSAFSRGFGRFVDYDPVIVCLQETKVCVCDENLVSALWGSAPHAFSYRPSAGASGGLLTIRDSSEVEVWSTTSLEHVLVCHGRFISSDEIFYVVNVYAPCDLGAKQRLWDSLSVWLQSLVGERVCVCGDFNAVRGQEERRSSRVGPRQSDHLPFNCFIEDNNLVDLPLGGRKYTWYKGDGLSMSRLDRFLLSEEWCLAWPNCTQVALLRGLSDHCPLVLVASEEDWGPRPLRMLKCWKDVPGYDIFVKEKWNSLQVDGWGGFVLKEKLKLIKVALKEWHMSHVQNLPSRIDSLKTRLSDLDSKGEDEVMSVAEEGGANSKYFHLILASRRRSNTISSLQADGVTLEGVDPIRQAVFLHFASHFKARNVVRPKVDNLQFKQLSWPDSGSLTRPFSVEEVKAAVWDCDSFKSPGPDGVNLGFFKDFWAELESDVMRFFSEFHRNGKLTKGVNTTFIALIPKVDSPQSLNDFWPTSLVGNIYKILAKILDGILIANEVVDEARKTKKELMLFKVDFEKAYDSVDWDYLDDVMVRMSFPTLWRKWIKECVCTATASVLVNGSPTDTFPLETGLRQGDPLSPFLFLLAAEGLNVLMKTLVENNLFTGYSVGTQAPVSISHLQFADDTLLMGAKSWANVRALRAALVLFELMSGLKVNFNKSMLVGVNISESWLNEAASALHCNVGKIPFLYLGLSIGGDPRRLSFWEPVLSRIKKRLSGWKSRFLSFGGRLILLKSVLTSLPVYALSFFKAPSGVWRGVGSPLWVGERQTERGRGRGSSWWKEVVKIRDGVGGLGSGWFRENVAKRVGSGAETFFWTNPWLGDIPLCERFGRLFDLAKNKSSSVAEMFSLGWEPGGEAWVWRRQLWVWEEEMLRECQALLLNFSFQVQSVDSWQWQPDLDTGYSVCGAYQLLTSQDSVTLGEVETLIWHKQVPLKVSICAWRLLSDRLPTRAKLVSRGIISPEAHFCVSGCGDIETAQHLFFTCGIFGTLWSAVRLWIGFSSVDHHNPSDHFLHFVGVLGERRARRSFLQLIWLACVWVLWNERNNRLFRNTTQTVPQMLDKVKLYSLWWLKTANGPLGANLHSWWSTPLLCLGID
ncbi:hypothetical protein TSUD_407260 [Trifolium subterraneum]|uniref:Reverse transcriptase domain-containing protein n=1 Tax=Trifolium subterraneum TaxID=3900 RepID=A0A2Z6NYY9_TRISU|nr:hypothetical protein TSUD_407260 [Trifolium subterraneum]